MGALSLSQRRRCWILFFVVVVGLYHVFMVERFGDSLAYFSKALDNGTLTGFLIARYCGWTSRILLEALEVFFSLHLRLFRFFNFFVSILLLWAVVQLIPAEDTGIAVGLMIMYPFTQMSSAGWSSTLIVYLLPLCMCAVAYVSLDRIRRRGKCSRPLIIIGYLCAILGCNQEQYCLIYLCLLLYDGVMLRLSQKKLSLPFRIHVIIALFSLVFAFINPGNHSRYIKETATWMPEFSSYSLVDKAALGFNSTMLPLFNSYLIFAVLLVLIFSFVVKNTAGYSLRGKVMARLTAATPLAFLLASLGQKYFPLIQSFFNKCFSNVLLPDPTNWYSWTSYIQFAVFGILLADILISIFLMFKKTSMSVCQ